MVRGIEKFKDFFKDFADNYIIIGGTACEIHEEAFAQTPRATKDIDIILVVEALTDSFVYRFWEFVKNGRYQQRHKGTVEGEQPRHEYYRFMKPENLSFPYQVELFSRKLDLLNFPKDARITPVPTEENLSSLSAILMDDDYYRFTIEHSVLEDNVHIAAIESLICLKCKAFVDLSERRQRGEQVDSRNIQKHKKDVFRLAAMLAPADKFNIPVKIMDDIDHFITMASDDKPNDDFFRSAGLQGIKAEDIINQLRNSFHHD